MAGQGAIIAAGAIGYPPGFANANEQSLALLGVSKVMQITSTYDHRVIQGAQSGEYLAARRRAAARQATDSTKTSSHRSDLQAAAAAADVAARRRAPPRAAAAHLDEMLRAVAAGMAIVSAYRRHGHLAAHLDPLGTEPVGDPSLDPQTYGLTPALQSAIPASVLRVKVPGNTLAEVLPRLQRDVQLDDRVRDRAHLERQAARVAARVHRVGQEQGQALARSGRSSFSSG